MKKNLNLIIVLLFGIFAFSVLIFSNPAWADDIVTDIGQIPLTQNQILNYSPQGIWLKFSYMNGEVFAVSGTQPQQSDINALKSQLNALPDVVPQRIYIANFNTLQFQSGLFAALPNLSNFNLRLEFGALNTFATNRDFVGMNQYLGMLLSSGVATQNDVDTVKALVTIQGVII